MDGSAQPAFGFDLNELATRLRTAGFQVDTRQFLTAAEVLLECAARGIDVDGDPQVLGTYLAPVFCSSPEEQVLFGEVMSGFAAPREAIVEPAPSRGTPFRAWRTARWAVPIVVLLAATAGVLFFHRGGHEDARRRSPLTTVDAGSGDSSVPTDAQTKVESKLAPAPPAAEYDVREVAKITPRRPSPAMMMVRRTEWWPSIVEAFLGAAAAFLLWSVATRIRRVLVLQRLPVAARPDFATLAGDSEPGPSIDEGGLRRVTSLLRRPRSEQASTVMDVAASVEAAARSGGRALPVLAARRAIPEYLALVEQLGPSDHQARLYHRALDGLEARGLTVHRYTFTGDPRTCFERSSKQRSHLLGDVLGRHHRARPVLFMDATRCFSLVSGRLEPWVDQMRAGARPALLTPSPPYSWTRQEWHLAELGFLVLPAGDGIEGLGAYGAIEFDADWNIERLFPTRYARPFPALLESRPGLAFDREIPALATIEKLVKQLEGYLGPDGLAWLAACAVYPEIDWRLTLHVANAVLPRLVADRRTTERQPHRDLMPLLVNLARLPWFRVGFVPEWLRMVLLTQLSHDREKAIRESLTLRLETLTRRTLGGKRDGVGLRIGAWVGPLDVLRTSDDVDPMHDAVFLGYMAGAHIPAPAVTAPTVMRRLFGHLGMLPPAAGTLRRSPRTLSQRLVGHARAALLARPTLWGAGFASLAGLLGLAALLYAHTTTFVPPADLVVLDSALARAGDRVVTTFGNQAELWDGTGKLVSELPIPRTAVSTRPAFNERGDLVFVGAHWDRGWLFDLRSAVRMQPIAARVFTAGPTDGWSATAVGKSLTVQRGGESTTFEVAAPLAQVIFSPDGTRLFAITENRDLLSWIVSSTLTPGWSSADLADTDGSRFAVDFSSDGKTIVFVLASRAIVARKVSGETERRIVLPGDGARVAALRVTPDDRVRVLYADGRMVERSLYDPTTQVALIGGVPSEAEIRAGSFDRTGSILAVSTSDSVLLYKIESLATRKSIVADAESADAGDGGTEIRNGGVTATGIDVRGGLDRAKVAKIVREGVGALRVCYQRALRSTPTLNGQMTVNWSISVTGSVSGVRIEKDTLRVPAVQSCVKGVVGAWRFPRPSGGTAQVSMPFVFKGTETESPDTSAGDSGIVDADELIKQARSAWLRQKCAKAIDFSRRALKVKPGTPDAYQIIAVCSCSSRDSEEASRAFAKLDERSRPLVANLCAKNGIHLGGPSDTSSNEEMKPTPSPAARANQLYAQAQAAWRADRCGDAIDLAQKALEASPAGQAAFEIIATCSCSLRRPDQAKVAFKNVLASSRSSVKATCAKNGIDLEGPILEPTRPPNDAAVDGQGSTEPSPAPVSQTPRGTAGDLVALARQAWLDDRCPEAIELARRAAKAGAGNAAYEIVTFCSCQLKKAEDARGAYQLIATDGDMRLGRASLATACAKQGIELEKATAKAQVGAPSAPKERLSIDPGLESLREHYTVALRYYDTGRYDDAIREFEALYEAKSDPAFLYNLAQTHRLAGHTKEAIQLYRNYLGKVPQAPNRTEIDERIKTLERQLSSAQPGRRAD